jgi:TRAP-type C4-dicarboxylate transport system permease small subunit
LSNARSDAADAGGASDAPRTQSRLAWLLVAVGSVGVVATMLIDVVAVVGRHAGLPLTGSIEMAQAAVVMMASCSIAFATLERAHVAVDLLHSRMGAKTQIVVLRIAALLGFVFMSALVVSSVWVAVELWDGAERTELLEIPLQPLRLLWIGCASVAAIGFLIQAVRPHAGRGHA